MFIGKPKRIYTIEPLVSPVPGRPLEQPEPRIASEAQASDDRPTLTGGPAPRGGRPGVRHRDGSGSAIRLADGV